MCFLVCSLCDIAVARDDDSAQKQDLPPAKTNNAEDVAELKRLHSLHAKLTEQLKEQLAELQKIEESQPNAIDQYSRRGDLQMFLGHYAAAVTDYQAMIRLNSRLDASHWRLGIALFFDGKPESAAAQFDKYHSFDDVDRENGIWRYLSHFKAYGAEKARAELLRYAKDDRPPFPEVYQLFEGKLTNEEVMAAIPGTPASEASQSLRFYSNLYIGMNEVVNGRIDSGNRNLLEAVLNPWPRTAGYGPSYMWHVARLQYFELNPVHLDGQPAQISN